MTDQIQQARRAAFEAWYNKQWTLCERCGNSKDFAWQGFNAAIDSLCIELPRTCAFESIDPSDFSVGLTYSISQDSIEPVALVRLRDVRAAIEQTNMGIKIK